VLARANRLVRAADFREVVRRGRRSTTPGAVYYRLPRAADDPLRFGLIVSRAVGGAVDRNRLRRRYRAIGRELVDAGGRSMDVVIRALPGAGALSWQALSADVHGALDEVVGAGR